MSVEDKFYAAVNVIRGLPKNGSYQPSHELMLKFYAYYKQATEGPNRFPKPAFWEVIRKAKWEAWSRLGNMSKEEAMEAYVEELNKIVETMAYTDNVADFLSSLDAFYSTVPVQDIEMCIGPALEKVRSRSNSPLTNSPLESREASPIRVKGKTFSSEETSPDEEDDDEEDFLDTVDQHESEKHHQKHEDKGSELQRMEKDVVEEKILTGKKINNLSKTPNGVIPNGRIGRHKDSNLEDIVHKTVVSLRNEMASLSESFRKLEDAYRKERQEFWWGKKWRNKTLIALILWPVVLQILIILWSRRRRITSY